jgi:hypothetical protein
MTRARLVLVLVLAALLVPAPGALAQDGNPFDGLPPAPPPPAPTAEPADDPSGGDITRETMWIIGGALLVVFIGIGMWISRDARRNLPAGERDDPRRTRDEGPHKHERQAKAKARAKGRAQRQARKAGRKTRR